MPNCMTGPLRPCWRSGARAEQALERLHGLGPTRLLEHREPRLRLLERRGDERALLARRLPLELVLDVGQVELLLVDDALEHLAVLAPIEAREVDVELVVGEALDGVDAGEDDDPPEIG